MQNKTLVIVPAKGISLRLPNKNLLPFNNLPLFLVSCNYAKSEGFSNIVVSSDNDDILKIASEAGYMIYKENVDESRLENCINQVLSLYKGYDTFIVLQPTSPLRESNFLRNAILLKRNCIISVQKIKPIAFFNDIAMFNTKNRVLAQDCKQWIYHFDGSIIIRNVSDYLNNMILILSDCELIENKFPFYLQIDSKEEYELLRRYNN